MHAVVVTGQQSEVRQGSVGIAVEQPVVVMDGSDGDLGREHLLRQEVRSR